MAETRHTVRFAVPDMIVRGVSHTLRAPVYLYGALVVPASATVSVYDAGGVVRVSAASATITSGVAMYTIGSGVLTGQPLGERWVVEWAITLTGGAVLTPRNDAALVRNGLWPVVTDLDLIRRVPSLSTQDGRGATSNVSYQDALDEAWNEIQLRLIARGNRPNLILEPSALRMVHLHLAAALVFENESSRLGTAHAERAAMHRAEYEQHWTELNPRYSVTDEVTADVRRRSATPTISLSGGDGRASRIWR